MSLFLDDDAFDPPSNGRRAAAQQPPGPPPPGNAPYAGRRSAQPRAPAGSVYAPGARSTTTATAVGQMSGRQRPVRPVSSRGPTPAAPPSPHSGGFTMGGATRPSPPPGGLRGRSSTGIGAAGQRTYTNTLFDDDDTDDRGNAFSSGDVLGGAGGSAGDQLAVAQKMQQQRQLAAQKRRERQMLSGTVEANNGAVGRGAPALAPGSFRPRPPGDGAPIGGGAYTKQNPLLATASPPMSPGPGVGVGASQFERSSSMYASTNLDHPEPPAGVSSSWDARRGVRELERDLEAAGLDAEYDPNEGRHPAEVAAERERERKMAAARATGSAKAVRIAGRPVAARVDVGDRRAFLQNPGPKNGAPVQCHIVRKRKKGWIPGTKGSHPEYYLWLDGANAKAGSAGEDAKFLLCARRRKKSKTSNYIISLDEEDTARNSGNYFGKVRSNFVGTEFCVYDKGTAPGKAVGGDGGLAALNPRSELAVIKYETNVLGTKGPRKMSGAIPAVDENGRRAQFNPIDKNGTDGMMRSLKNKEHQDMIVLMNKSPKWNESMGAYCLNFNGRVTAASVKNFQLCDVNAGDGEDDGPTILQFGKVGKDVFTMDYAYPMSALQAFGICMTSFDNKLACE